MLERFALDKSKQNLQPVILRLSLDVHALLSELARLLRRRLPAIAAELVYRGADTLDGWMEEAREHGTMNGAEMPHYPE